MQTDICVVSCLWFEKHVFSVGCWTLGLHIEARRTACVGLMCAQRRRHWSDIGPALDPVSSMQHPSSPASR